MPSGKLCCRWLKRNLDNEPTTSTARGEMGGGGGGGGGVVKHSGGTFLQIQTDV